MNATHNQPQYQQLPRSKEFNVALVLAWGLGIFGADRFYLGYTALGVVKLFTFGGLGIWALIDFIFIASNNMRDVEGNQLVKTKNSKVLQIIFVTLTCIQVLISLMWNLL